MIYRKHSSNNGGFYFVEWLRLSVVFYMEQRERFAAPEHGWLGWLACLMRLEQFPFDLWLPLSCQFMLRARLPPILPRTPCCHLHFTSPSCAIAFFASTTGTIAHKTKRIKELARIRVRSLVCLCHCSTKALIYKPLSQSYKALICCLVMSLSVINTECWYQTSLWSDAILMRFTNH